MLELFDRALLKRGGDEIRSNYISYNASHRSLLKAPKAGPIAPAAVDAASRSDARARRVPAAGRRLSRSGTCRKGTDKAADKGKDAKAAGSRKAPAQPKPAGAQAQSRVGSD